MVRETTHHLALFDVSLGRMMGSGRRGVEVRRSAWHPVKQEGQARLPVLPKSFALLTDTELVDDRAVPLHIGLLEVIKKPAAASDELQKAAAGVVILRVRLEVLGEVGNAVREECNLHFWRPGIGVMNPILVNEVRLRLLRGGQNPVS
jgi:hypothetical protein